MKIDETMGAAQAITNEKFNEMLLDNAEWIKRHLSDGETGELAPMLQVYAKKNGEDAYILVAFENFEYGKRHELLAGAGYKFGSEGVAIYAVYFLTEVWVSKEVGPGATRKYARPELDPNRTEAISVAALTFDGRAAMARVNVTRDKKNKMIPGEIDIYPYGGEVRVENEICKSFWRGYLMGAIERGANASAKR